MDRAVYILTHPDLLMYVSSQHACVVWPVASGCTRLLPDKRLPKPTGQGAGRLNTWACASAPAS